MVKHKNGQFHYNIDTIQIEEEQTVIAGWVVFDDAQVDIEVSGAKKSELLRVDRADVIEYFDGELGQIPSVCGFKIYLETNQLKKVRLCFKANGQTKVIKPHVAKPKGTSWRQLLAYCVDRQNIRRGIHYLRQQGLVSFFCQLWRVLSKVGKADYSRWYQNHKAHEDELAEQRKAVFTYAPLISILIPTFNTPENFLREAIDSVLAQTYTNWELCIADGSTEADIWPVLQEYAAADPRIRVKRLGENLGISGNTNQALAMAQGAYIALFDHDDLLTPDALYEIVRCLNEQEVRPDFIYTDEDKVDAAGKKYFDPNFKPDFSPDMLRSINYICHFTVIEAALLEKAGGGFRPEYDGAQDFDLFLRCTEKARSVAHVTRILYHWRMHEKSTASKPGSKPYTHIAGQKALEQHLLRIGRKGRVLDGAQGRVPNLYKVEYDLLDEPLVSILIPNYNHKRDLEKCLNSIWKKTTYRNYEILIVENNSTQKDIFAYYEELKEKPGVRVVYWKEAFNYSAINNWAAAQAKGDYFVLLNNDIEIISSDWLEQLLMFAQFPEYGAVGAKLYYQDKTVQHGGVIVGIGGVAGHAHKGFEHNAYGYFNRLCMVHDLSAVTAALMMVRRDVFEQVHGLDEEFSVAFNDVDFCLRIREAGYLIVLNPDVEAWHYESKSRGIEDTVEKQERFRGETERFLARWTEDYVDPYYNVNLTLNGQDFSLRM